MAAKRQPSPINLARSCPNALDHYQLMTDTPHKGDPAGFRRIFSLLVWDAYGEIASLKEALGQNTAPFHMRRTKEALVTISDLGEVKGICTNRHVEAIDFEISMHELDFYDSSRTTSRSDRGVATADMIYAEPVSDLGVIFSVSHF